MDGELVGDSISYLAECMSRYVLGLEPQDEDGALRHMDEKTIETEGLQTQHTRNILFSFSSHKVVVLLCDAKGR